MMGGSFTRFAELCEFLEKTPERNGKIRLVADYLRSLSPEDARVAAYLLIGRVSEEKGREPLNVGWATVVEAIEEGKTQTLITTELTLQEVWETLKKISKQEGHGSRERKKSLLRMLFSLAGELERKWLLRILFSEMRHGVNSGVLLDAVAQVVGMSEERIRRIDMLLGDVGELVERALRGGLGDVRLRVFNPVKPMLAEMCYSTREALIEHGGRTVFEPKFDGVRLQIHIKDSEVRLFTRRLTEVTNSLPDIVELVKGSIVCGSAIVDGEIMAIDRAGKPLPFQETMKRVGRERGIEIAISETPLRLQVFDILFLDGGECIDKPLLERRKLLEGIVREESILTPQLITESHEEAGKFLQDAVEKGYEGLMAKEPYSAYTPGRRGGKWLKIKPAETLDVVIIAAEWGHGRRQGWLSNYHLAVVDEETGDFEMVGKSFKGLTDKEFEEMTTYLQSIKIRDTEWGVVVKPELVVEVAYNEIQKSPRYRSGFALRFARIINIRKDKRPEDADSLQKLRRLYEEQFRRKGRTAEEEI